MIGEEIRALVASARLDLSCEAETQADLQAVFLEAFGEDRVRREVRLSASDRPDFMIDRWAVEVKNRGQQPRAIMRQLERYATYAEVEGIVLASNVAMGLPPSIGGKPAVFVSTGRGWL